MPLELSRVSLFPSKTDSDKIFELFVDYWLWRESQFIVNEKSLLLKGSLELVLKRVFLIDDVIEEYS